MRNIPENFPTVEYDPLSRMKYNSFFHPNQGKKFTEGEIIYICKFWEKDKTKNLSLALGRTETSLAKKIQMLRMKSQYEFYKNFEGDYEE